MAYFRNLFGGQNDKSRDLANNAAEIIENLVERVETSTALDDRRDALKALRSLAKKMRLPVATIGMNAYMDILEKESLSPDIVAITLEILVAVVSDDEDSEEGFIEDKFQGNDEISERLAEIIVRKKKFIPSVIALIESYDFNVRRAAIQLLTALLRHRASEVQAMVIEQPVGVSRLLQLLYDTREIIRNNAVLMLGELSRSNSQIQQLLAYENTFQLLLDIIDLEPVESIVIEDCLFVILNLLRKNSSNQELFREASLVQRLSVLLHLFFYGREDETDGNQESEWPRQKIANLIFLLQVIRSLVSPSENAQSTVSIAQKTINRSGILSELCDVLLSELGLSVDILTETVTAVAEIIRGNYANQEYFASRSLMTTAGTRPSLIVLLMSMTTEKQPFKLRCAVFYCFLSYLHENEFGKTKTIDTLLPANSTNESEVTTGQCICSAILSSEGIQVWMGCVCLMHCILDVDHLKQQLLRVQLSTTVTDVPSSLLQHVGSLLVSLGNRKPQVRIGLLMLLSVWLCNSPLVISHFLQVDENIQYLTTYIDDCGVEGTESENQVVKGLMAVVLTIFERRIGKIKLIELFEEISRSEHYVRAAQRPQPLAKSSQELILDYQFSKFFKVLEGQLTKLLRPEFESTSSEMNGATGSVVASFKELIKRQDETIADLNQQLKKLNDELSSNVQFFVAFVKVNGKSYHNEVISGKELAEKCTLDDHKKEIDRFATEHYQNIVSQWQAYTQRYQQWAEQWQEYQISQLPNPQDTVVNQLNMQVKELEEQLNYGWQMYEAQTSSLVQSVNECYELKAQIKSLQDQLATAVQQLNLFNSGHKSVEVNNSEELISLKKEQEDLLVLLADQDLKISQYRQRLVDLGQAVTDDEECVN
ncbi:unnamed protein product [Dracunculus medinensis]|uniref:General vesicular transport factor p115 n=1 Tax=Dracunculus medinensis TaxID=318479 RepID=A0A0N4U6W5_DRAME|nr:unnamed protein product [Dracunculus medinensis]